MKFEKITDTKIKIILSVKDLETSNISVENILSNSADSQKLLENIISKAEKELGFNPGDSQLLIEALSQTNGNCIFTITKILDDIPCCKEFSKSFIYKFDTFDNFINLCNFLNNFSYLNFKDFSKKFSLIFYNNTYYLQALDTQKFAHILCFIKPFLDEFGADVSNSAGIEGILNEYGKIIFTKNAMQKCLHTFTKNEYKKI